MYIKLVNETNKCEYDSALDLANLLNYIFKYEKTQYDSKRANFFLGDYSGCEPFESDREYEHDSTVIYDYMMACNNSKKTNPDKLAKHRIVSFAPTDLVLPQDLDSLGRRIAYYYSQKGHISAYSVHFDTNNPHIHIVVDSISFKTGKRLHIHNEWIELNQICQKWYEKFCEIIETDEDFKAVREQILYGEDVITYGSVPLSAEDQMRINYINAQYH